MHPADLLVVTCPACAAGAEWLRTHEPRAVVPATIHRHASQDGWFRLYAPAAWADEGQLAAITGKYLFFSPDRAALIGLAGVELAQYGFPAAKVPYQRAGSAYVLCLYAPDASRKRELADRLADYRAQWSAASLEYRYWKSNDATLAGQYSAQFLRSRRR